MRSIEYATIIHCSAVLRLSRLWQSGGANAATNATPNRIDVDSADQPRGVERDGAGKANGGSTMTTIVIVALVALVVVLALLEIGRKR